MYSVEKSLKSRKTWAVEKISPCFLTPIFLQCTILRLSWSRCRSWFEVGVTRRQTNNNPRSSRWAGTRALEPDKRAEHEFNRLPFPFPFPLPFRLRFDDDDVLLPFNAYKTSNKLTSLLCASVCVWVGLCVRGLKEKSFSNEFQCNEA